MSAAKGKMLDLVMDWARGTGYEVASLPDTGNDFVVELSERPELPSVQFVHRRPELAYMLVVSQVRIPVEDRLRLRDGMGMGYDHFIWEMKRELIKGGLDLTVLGEDERDPDAWEVQRRLYLDGVGANDLHDAYVKVKNSIIGVIWSYRQAMEGLEQREMPSQTVPGAVAIGPERTARIINTVLNVSVIMMVSLMDGMTDMMMGMTGAMAGAFGGEEAEEEVQEAIPEAKAKVREMISEVRTDYRAKVQARLDEIEELIVDPAFDAGPEIVDIYEFGLPMLTEELNDEEIEQYVRLLVQEDKYFTEMFGELTRWMGTLPELPK